MELPNRFEPGDGLRLLIEGEAATKETASEQACRAAVSRLLMERPGLVVLRQAHWKVSVDDLIANIALPGGGPLQALPVQVNARRAQLASEKASERYTDLESWESRVADLLRHILHRHANGI